MAKPKSFSNDVHFRIKKVKTLETIEQIFNDNKNKYDTVSDILNDALDAGVKILKDGTLPPSSIEDIVKKEVKKSIDTQYRLTKKIMFQMKKMTVLSSVQELMISSMLQEFELYLKAQGVKLDDALLENFKNSLPKRFEEDKQYFLSQIMLEIDKDKDEDE